MSRRPSATDAEILAAARRAINQYGWSGTTIEKIAAEAGVSRVTLHRRGLDKAQILARLGELATESYRTAIWPALTASGSARERLTTALEVVCELAEANLNLLLALDASANASVFHDGAEPEASTRGVFTEPLERLLRDGSVDGTLRETDAEETATVLFNMVGWTYIHLRSGHGWNSERAQTATLDLALNGLVHA
jgi:AcrR family transcriptional regulator